MKRLLTLQDFFFTLCLLTLLLPRIAYAEQQNAPSIFTGGTLGTSNEIVDLIAQGADVNAVNENGMSALHISLREHRYDVAEALLQHGANIDAMATNKYTILTLSVRECETNVVEFLIKHGANVNINDGNGHPALLYAVALENKGITDLLLDHAANPNIVDFTNYPLIHRDIQTIDIIESLILHGADVNAVKTNGINSVMRITPLIQAAGNNRKDIVNVLLKHGANINANSWLGTALNYASTQGYKDIVEILLDNGADMKITIDDSDNMGSGPLFYAMAMNHKDIIDIFIAHGADIESPDNDGWTLLHHAILDCNKDMVQYLLTRNANIDAKNGMSALEMAFECDDVELIHLLIENGCRVDPLVKRFIISKGFIHDTNISSNVKSLLLTIINDPSSIKINKHAFIRKLRNEYPQYNDMSDEALYDRVIAQYPQYRKRIKD